LLRFARNDEPPSDLTPLAPKLTLPDAQRDAFDHKVTLFTPGLTLFGIFPALRVRCVNTSTPALPIVGGSYEFSAIAYRLLTTLGDDDSIDIVGDKA
jgi:hypothetical protein